MEPMDAQGLDEEAIACDSNSGENRNATERPPLQNKGESSDDYISRLDGWKTHQSDVLQAAYHGRDSNLLIDAFLALTTAVENAKLGALKEDNKVLTEDNAAKDKALKNYPTFSEVAKLNISFPNETDDATAKCEDDSGDDRNVAERPPPKREDESYKAYIARLNEWKDVQTDALFDAYQGCDHALLREATRALSTSVEMLRQEATDALGLEDYPTFCEVARRDINFPNETDSSSHTKTGHLPASHTHMERPSVDLPSSFWQSRTHVNFKARINSEVDVNAELRYLLRDIARALGLNSYLFATLGLPIMDIAQDVAILSQQTERIAGIVEGKKHPSSLTEEGKIFGSDTRVAGEVFEQLLLVSLQNETFAVGLVATLQSFQLVCTKNVGNEVLTANDAIGSFESELSSANLEKTPGDPHRTELSMNRCSKRSKIEWNKTSKKGSERSTNSGPGAIDIENEQIERRYFATTPVSFGNEEASNRKVFELLAAYLLLCVKSLKEEPNKPFHLPQKGDSCLARKLSLGSSSFPFKQIRFNRDIAFDTRLKISDKDLFVIRQLGYGLSGASCFGCTQTIAAPCVIKFFRKKYTIETAKAEESHWHSLYSELGFQFVQATATPRVLLLMPFLRVPRDLSARKHFLEGAKTACYTRLSSTLRGKATSIGKFFGTTLAASTFQIIKKPLRLQSSVT